MLTSYLSCVRVLVSLRACKRTYINLLVTKRGESKSTGGHVAPTAASILGESVTGRCRGRWIIDVDVIPIFSRKCRATAWLSSPSLRAKERKETTAAISLALHSIYPRDEGIVRNLLQSSCGRIYFPKRYLSSNDEFVDRMLGKYSRYWISVFPF